MSFNSNLEVSIQRLINSLENDADLRKISASGGSKLYGDTSSHETLNVKSLYVREDTVITTLSGFDNSGNSVNFLTEFNINGATLTMGDLYMVPNSWKIVTIQLASGSIIAYS